MKNFFKKNMDYVLLVALVIVVVLINSVDRGPSYALAFEKKCQDAGGMVRHGKCWTTPKEIKL